MGGKFGGQHYACTGMLRFQYQCVRHVHPLVSLDGPGTLGDLGLTLMVYVDHERMLDLEVQVAQDFAIADAG